MSDFEIKKVNTIAECVACNKMLEKLIKFEASLLPTIEVKKINNFYENTLKKPDCVIFFAKNCNTPVGYVMAYIKNQTEQHCGEIVIMNLFVENKFRGKSIGQNLIKSVENWANEKFDTYTLNLKCIAQNTGAINFYQKLGFFKVEENDNFCHLTKKTNLTKTC